MSYEYTTTATLPGSDLEVEIAVDFVVHPEYRAPRDEYGRPVEPDSGPVAEEMGWQAACIVPATETTPATRGPWQRVWDIETFAGPETHDRILQALADYAEGREED